MDKKSKGDFIMKQGDADHSMMLLLKGELDIFVEGRGGQTKKVGHILPGQIVGEMALLSQESRTASVKVSKDAEVLSIDATDLGASE